MTATDAVAPMASAWVVRLVVGLSEQAVAWVTEAIYREYATMLSPLGTRRRMQTRQDIFYHLEFHGLGLRIVCDGFALRGWSVQFLGANVPSDALVMQVDQCRPELVGLSASLVQHLPEMRRVVAEIRSEMGANRPAIVVGGLATNEVDKIWSWVGADMWSPDAQTALATGGL